MSIFLIVTYAICGIYMLLNFKHDIQMLQQNSYRIDRYWRWQKQNFFPIWRLIDLALIFLVYSTLLTTPLKAFMVAAVALGKIFYILTRKFKKPLVFTRRVWRIYTVTAIISLLLFVGMIFHASAITADTFIVGGEVTLCLGTLLMITTFSYLIVVAAVWLLQPVEKMINNRYYNDAKRILSSMPDLKIIGVTGSYGKTSTKHYLHRILSEKYDVLMTPGSFNTPMGVIRTVREHLKPYHTIFICEMGAKQTGDIKEICDLVNPQMGIVTAVGPMHLESFKTIENVQATKFELADALPADGLAVVNNDFEYCANRKVDNVPALRYGVANTEGADFTATDIEYTPDGTSFTVRSADGKTALPIRTRLVGEFNISNLLAAIIIALRLGVPEEKIQYAVSHIEQVEHRLNLKRTPGGVTIIDDAFNSNPTGSRMAVDVLKRFNGGKRIIVTPGMIELGERQFELNKALGKHIGESVDIAIVVGKYNRDALTEGIRETMDNNLKLIEVDSFADAQKQLATILAPGDTVLYENDLPDTFK